MNFQKDFFSLECFYKISEVTHSNTCFGGIIQKWFANCPKYNANSLIQKRVGGKNKLVFLDITLMLERLKMLWPLRDREKLLYWRTHFEIRECGKITLLFQEYEKITSKSRIFQYFHERVKEVGWKLASLWTFSVLNQAIIFLK